MSTEVPLIERPEGATEGQSVPASRPSKTNPADPPNNQHGPSTARSLNRRLTERDGVDLRAECVVEDRYGSDAVTWRKAKYRWRDYIQESGETSAVFENIDGDQVKGGDPNRFMSGYADKQYAKLKDLERGLRAEYGKRLHTAMLTFSASSTDDDGNPLSPVDHLLELLASWEAVTRELRRCMEGRRYERLAILEPHKSGYLHIHMAVFVDGVVAQEDFTPVIQAHLRNCDLAGEDAHNVIDDSTISINRVGTDRDSGELENLGTYLAEYLGTYGDDPLDAPEHQEMANAILWATGKQRWRPSNGAQTYMRTNRGESTGEWEFVGIEDKNGDFHECGSGGGVERATTATYARKPDPPPDDGPDRWGGIRSDPGAPLRTCKPSEGP